MAGQVRQCTTPVNSPEIQNYTAQIGSRLSAQMPGPNRTYTFEVVSTDRSNALHEPVSLPGGYIFVPLDLLRATDTESEFAGMLAQTMARKSIVPLASPGSIPVMTIIGESFSGTEPPPFARQQRQIELDAGKTAVLAMSKAGFDPAALLRYIERVQPSPERDTALKQAIQNLRPATYSESDEYARIRALIPTPPRSSALKPPPSLLH